MLSIAQPALAGERRADRSAPTQDIVLGCYYMTMVRPTARKGEGKIFANTDEAMLAYDIGVVDLQAPIKVRLSAGKVDERAAASRRRLTRGRASSRRPSGASSSTTIAAARSSRYQELRR